MSDGLTSRDRVAHASGGSQGTQGQDQGVRGEATQMSRGTGSQVGPNVRAANPPGLTHHYKNIQFTNQDIFDAIQRQWDLGISHPISIGDLERRAMALDLGEFENFGEMLGAPLCIDHNGEFKVGYSEDLHNQWEKERLAQQKILNRRKTDKPEPEPEPTCKHRGFVARETLGDDKYVCRECGERFPQHPWLPKPTSPLDATWYASPKTSLEDAMLDFRAGMKTFSESCRRAAVSAEEFKEAIKKAFPPAPIIDQVYTIGNSKSRPIVIGEEPQRTSDPEEVENIFATPGVSKEDLQKIWETAFPDVTEVSWGEDHQKNCAVIILSFIDGTDQRVEISFNELRPSFSSLVAPITRSVYTPSQVNDIFHKTVELYKAGTISDETFTKFCSGYLE